jgi:cytochrome c
MQENVFTFSEEIRAFRPRNERRPHMEREVLERIVEAIHGGDSTRALEIATAVLNEMDLKNPEADFSTDYEIRELVVEDAKRLVEEAMRFYRNCGREIALAEFSNPKGRFVKGQLYVFAMDSNGIMLAHPINERYIGKDFLRVVDFEGRHFVRDILKAANTQGWGWVEYIWLNPVSGNQEPKTVYCEKHNDAIICSGIYDHH